MIHIGIGSGGLQCDLLGLLVSGCGVTRGQPWLSQSALDVLVVLICIKTCRLDVPVVLFCIIWHYQSVD